MITNTFDYLPLSREEINGKRLYLTPNGNKLPSVTTILSATESAEKQESLNNWRKSVGEHRAKEITQEAAHRGNRMHSYLEHYVLDGKMKPKGTNPYSWPSYDMANVVIEHGLSKVSQYWGMEVPLYFPDLYAGTCDCIGIHENKEAIIDFKQSNKPKKTEWIENYFIQLTMYANAHNEVYNTNIKKGVIMMCVKPTEISPGNYSKQPEYQQWILEGNEWDYYEQKMWKRLELYYSQFH
jgi:genome maintenance exonuclease 1